MFSVTPETCISPDGNSKIPIIMRLHKVISHNSGRYPLYLTCNSEKLINMNCPYVNEVIGLIFLNKGSRKNSENLIQLLGNDFYRKWNTWPFWGGNV